MCGTSSLQTDLLILQEENDAMRYQIAELQSWFASGNQVPGNVSVAEGTKISQLKTNNAGIMCGDKSIM